LNRQKQLSDPSYESQLKQEVGSLKIKLSTYEATVKKGEGKQKLREKALNTVLDTGEMAELQKIFAELNTEISLYTKRYEKLEKLNSQTAQSSKDIIQKTKEFSAEYESLKDKTGDLEDPKKKEMGNNNEKLSRKLGVVSGEYNSKSNVLNLKIKKLQEALEKQQKIEDELQSKLDKTVQEHKKYLTELNDLQSKVAYKARRVINDEFMNDDLMFLTEQVN
jgi:Arc/MetJ-type ribon-helix-helix transcriptional regulator